MPQSPRKRKFLAECHALDFIGSGNRYESTTRNIQELGISENKALHGAKSPRRWKCESSSAARRSCITKQPTCPVPVVPCVMHFLIKSKRDRIRFVPANGAAQRLIEDYLGSHDTRHNLRSDELMGQMSDNLGGQGRAENSVQVFCKLLIVWDLRTVFCNLERSRRPWGTGRRLGEEILI
jgi:hypothetical protein